MKSTRGSKLDRPTTTILQSDLGFHLTPGSPLFEEKKSSNAGVKHAVGVSFERTEAVSRALSRTRERERERSYLPTHVTIWKAEDSMDTWSRFSITRRGHYDRCP